VAKAIVYLIGVAFSLLLLRATGLLDGMFDRGNLREREKFWQETVAKEAPEGTPKSALEVLVARHGMALDCFHSSLKPPVEECRADDPASKGGGMAAHPMALQLRFTLRDEKLAKFEAGPHALK